MNIDVSIITPVLNNEKTIEHCINSVINQKYNRIEYIIVDGGSTDNTLGIINKYKNKIFKVISGKDKGLYDAMNKGIDASTGEIVGILNSDDFYANDSVINEVVNNIMLKNVDSCYGDLEYVDNKDINIVKRYWKSPKVINNYKKLWLVPHPAFFVKKYIYKKYGLFNLTYHYSADFELICRFLFKNKVSTSYIPKVLTKMRTGGLTNRGLKNIIKANIEIYNICKQHGIKIWISDIVAKLISKVIQVRF